MSRSLKKGPFTDDHLVKKVEVMNTKPQKIRGENLVAPLDDHSGVHRAHACRAQRQEIHSGVRDGEHGGAQAGRIFAHPHLQGTRREVHRKGGEIKMAHDIPSLAKAEARYMHVSAQKARLVVDMIRGRQAGEAINILSATNKRIAPGD